jgi:hypothetical protein
VWRPATIVSIAPLVRPISTTAPGNTLPAMVRSRIGLTLGNPLTGAPR